MLSESQHIQRPGIYQTMFFRECLGIVKNKLTGNI